MAVALEQEMNADVFCRQKGNHRCHKSYIINIHKICSVEPYGRWTYIVKFKGISETVLITHEKYNEIKDRFQ